MVLVKPNYLKQVDWMKSPGKLLKKKKKTVRNRKESRKEEIEREREGGKNKRK